MSSPLRLNNSSFRPFMIGRVELVVGFPFRLEMTFISSPDSDRHLPSATGHPRCTFEAWILELVVWCSTAASRICGRAS